MNCRVVAAGNIRKYDRTFVPLQDNVALVTQGLMHNSPVINWLVSWHWAHIANFLVAFLCIPFSCAWDQVGVIEEKKFATTTGFVIHLWAMKMNIFTNVQIPYSGFSIASRALMMHIIVRVVRTVSFLAVVLPNARTPTCYTRRFPPVPETMSDFIWTGLSTLKGFGGCNDLILRHDPFVSLQQRYVWLQF